MAHIDVPAMSILWADSQRKTGIVEGAVCVRRNDVAGFGALKGKC